MGPKPKTNAGDVDVQGNPDEGGATVNHEGAGHADAMEPYGDALANSDQVAVNAPTNGPDTVIAPTGAELPANTGGIDPEGPVVTNDAPLPEPGEKLTTILAPNEVYTGVSASVSFVNGKGQTSDKQLVEWFREHGYTIEGDE